MGKKAIVANLNMDLSASRRAEVESNRLEIPGEQELEQSPLDQSYFTVREQSLLGDCQTSYSIHELPKYESMEIEQQILEDEQKRNSKEHLIGGLSLAKEVCLCVSMFCVCVCVVCVCVCVCLYV